MTAFTNAGEGELSPLIFYTLEGCKFPCCCKIRILTLSITYALLLAPAIAPTIESTTRPSPDRIVYQWEALTHEELRGFLVEYQVNISESRVNCSHTTNQRSLTTIDSKVEISNLEPTKKYCISVRARTKVNYGPVTSLTFVPCKLL